MDSGGAVWVCGAGMVSAIGASVGEALESLAQGRSGVGAMQFLQSVHREVFPVGEVKRSSEELAAAAGLPPWVTRTALLSMLAAREALQSAGLPESSLLTPHPSPLKTGFLSATTVGGMDKTTSFYKGFLKNPAKGGRLREVVHHECGSPTELVAERLGIRDFVTTASTACSSSANSILLAARMIRHGSLDIAVAGGADALSTFTLNGFNTLMILDRLPCRPFDRDRAGLNLGEGAAYLVLMSEKALQASGAQPLCRLSGWCSATDAYHQTASSPEGEGSFLAMKGALEKSGTAPAEVGYVNAHGTGTPNNDQSEGAALRRLFGERCPPFSSTKAFTGHTLGASGGVEAVLSALSAQRGLVYPNLNFNTPIEGLELAPAMRFLEGQDIRHVLSNSFGFGGNCTSLVFSKS